MSEIATQQPVGVIAEIRSPAFQTQLAQALPPGITPERFARITVTALLDDQARQREPSKQLLAADRASLYQAVIKCAQDGLLPDGRQAALVKRGDKVVYQPMVAGLRAIAARYGWTLRGGTVRASDEFEYTDEPQSMFHKVAATERGELVYAYAVARHKDGRREQRVMTAAEVSKRMESATSKNVWQSWPDEMWQKTAVRDLFQELALAPEFAEVLREELALDPVETLYGPQDSAEEAPLGATAPAETAAIPPVAPQVDDEPGPAEADPTPEAPAAVDINELAEAAAKFVPPNGKYSESGAHGPKTIAEIMETGKVGSDWLAWALLKIDKPAAYVTAVNDYARVFAPAIYTEAISKKDLA